SPFAPRRWRLRSSPFAPRKSRSLHSFAERRATMANPQRISVMNHVAVLRHGMSALGVAWALLCLGEMAAVGAEEQPSPAPAPRLPRDDLLRYRAPDGAVFRVQTTDDWLRRRAEVLAGMQAVMGRLPGPEKKCPLDMQVEEEVDCGSHVRRLITYA